MPRSLRALLVHSKMIQDRVGEAFVGQITIHRVRLPKQALARLTEKERFLLVMIGRILNEVSALHRLIVFASNYRDTGSAADSIHASQALYFLRLFIGHLHEAQLLISSTLYSDPTGKYYRDRMERNGKLALVHLNKHFSRNSHFKVIRNGFAFHYDRHHAERVKATFRHLRTHEPLQVFIGRGYVNTHWHLSDTILGTAMLRAIGRQGQSRKRVFARLMNSTIKVARWTMAVCDHFLIAIVKERLGRQFVQKHSVVETIADIPSMVDVPIPVFVSEKPPA